MHVEITLVGMYHDLPYLTKLDMLGDSPSIVPAQARTAATLLKRLKGENFASITYAQRFYKISGKERGRPQL